MHELCKSVSDYIIIVMLDVLLAVRGEAVASVRIPRILVCVVAATTHKSPLVCID